jgi:hypothetical protein
MRMLKPRSILDHSRDLATLEAERLSISPSTVKLCTPSGPTIFARQVLLDTYRFKKAAHFGDEIVTQNQEATTHIDLVNSVLRVARVGLLTNPIKLGSTSKSATHCADAESFFDGLIRQIHRKRGGQARVTVFEDNGRPILIQKSHDEPSALSLATLSVLGAIYPPGTIFAVEEFQSDLRTKRTINKESVFRTKPLAGLVGVSPCRLAPWAYPDPLDAGQFAVARGEEVNNRRLSLVTRHTIDDFIDVATKLIGMCQ